MPRSLGINAYHYIRHSDKEEQIKNTNARLMNKTKPQSFDVLSLDLFETLLVRPFVKPVDAFIHLEKKRNIIGFAIKRNKAEVAAKKKATNEKCTLDEIYLEMEDSLQFMK